MNKKLLGIAAVALLGVSAAFAATTSTVYFTASGTLTKFVESQNAGVEDPNTGSGVDHSSDYKIGVSYVETSIPTLVDTGLNAEKVLKGEKATTGYACTVKYSTNGKTATGITENIKWNNPSYIYHEILVSELEFSKANDYVILPVVIYNAESSTMQTTKKLTKYSDASNYYFDLTMKDSVNGNAVSKFDVRLASSNEVALKGASLSCFSNSSTSAAPLPFKSKESTTLYLYIGINADVTSDEASTNEGKFSGYSILLPEFTEVQYS